jgi:hypothetical protein
MSVVGRLEAIAGSDSGRSEPGAGWPPLLGTSGLEGTGDPRVMRLPAAGGLSPNCGGRVESGSVQSVPPMPPRSGHRAASHPGGLDGLRPVGHRGRGVSPPPRDPGLGGRGRRQDAISGHDARATWPEREATASREGA